MRAEPLTVRGETNAVAIVRTLAIILEVLLSLVAFSTIILLVVCWNRKSEMIKDPASLSSAIEMIWNDPDVPKTVKWDGKDGKQSHLILRRGKIRAIPVEDRASLRSTNPNLVTPEHDQSVDHKLVLPFPMGLTAGTIFILILVGALIIVTTLWSCIRNRDGLDIPSRSPILTQMILNYLPVVFATVLEPFWTLLNRKLCILKPFDALRGGEARASQSIDLKYTSLPPQLIISRAFKSRHFLLVAVCGIGLSTNFLAVALNALMGTRLLVIDSDGVFLSTYVPSIDLSFGKSIGSDHLYIAAANFSHGAPLPSWVTRDRFFLPFQINTTSSLGDVSSYKAVTPGFGLNVDCTKLNVSIPIDNIIQPEIFFNESNVACMHSWETEYDYENGNKVGLELLAPLNPKSSNASQEDYDTCGSVLILGFLRANLNEDGPSVFTSSQWMVCEPTLVTALYEVQVSSSGRVEKFERQGNDSSDISLVGNASLSSIVSNLFPAFDDPMGGSIWRSGSYEDSWPGFLVKALTNSTTFIDPLLPAPGFYEIAPVVVDLLERLVPIILSLQPNAFVHAPHGSTVQGKMLVQCDRVFMSQPMFIVTVTLLMLNIAVGLAYYIYRPKPMPGGVPETIASVLALFDGSGLVKEKAMHRSWPVDWAFGYGKFIGVGDGRPKLGIERRPFVVPLVDTKNV